jgi:DNA relaxase NicK
MGKGPKGGIIQSSGEISHRLVQERGRWITPGTKATRLDLALTFALEKPLPLVRQACENPREDWTVILPHPDRGGGTLYVGNRKSDTFGRLYDKGAELNSHLPLEQQIKADYLWRAEIEYKRAYARRAWEDIDAEIRCGTFREFCADTVLSWFSTRGVYLPIMPKSPSVVSVASRAVDDVRTLKWLYEQVRPAVWRLAENGKEHDVAIALSINPQNFALNPAAYLEQNALQFAFFDKLS